MRKIRLQGMLMCVGVLLLLIPHVEATKPEAIDLSYDFESQILSVYVHHWSDEPDYGNYIQYLIVLKNDIWYTTKEYYRQDDHLGLSDSFKVQAQDGDIINVTAVCITHYWAKDASLSAVIVVEGPEESTTTTRVTILEPSYTTSIISTTDQYLPIRPSQTQKTIISIIPFLIGSIAALIGLLLVLERDKSLSVE